MLLSAGVPRRPAVHLAKEAAGVPDPCQEACKTCSGAGRPTQGTIRRVPNPALANPEVAEIAVRASDHWVYDGLYLLEPLEPPK